MPKKKPRTRKELIENADLNSAIRNHSSRIPVCFLVDCSNSDELVLHSIQEELEALLEHICSNRELRTSVELAVMSYAEKPVLLRPFAPVTEGQNLALKKQVTETVSLYDALHEVCFQIRRQKQVYNSLKIPYCRPTVFLFSTGRHETDTRVLEDFCTIQKNSGAFTLMPVTRSQDELFARISGRGKVFFLGGDLPISSLFDRIQNSMERMSASSGAAYQTLLDAMEEFKF